MGDRAAIIVAAVAAAVGVVAGRAALFVVSLALGTIITGEMLRLARARGANPAGLAALLGTAALFVVGFLAGERAPSSIPAAIAGALVLAFLSMTARRAREGVTQGLLFTVLPVVLVGSLGAYVLAIRSSGRGARLLVGLIALTVAADLGAALVRRARGGDAADGAHLAGGIAGSLVAGVVLAIALSPPFSWARALTLAILVGALTVCGSAIASMLERDAARPVRATLFRAFDGILLSAPVFFYAYRVLAR